jgi:hypothetical protein
MNGIKYFADAWSRCAGSEQHRQTTDYFQLGFDKYRLFDDKKFGLTDCEQTGPPC